MQNLPYAPVGSSQAHVPAGLRDPVLFSSKNAAVIQDLSEQVAERPPTVKSVLQPNIEHKFLSPASNTPLLDKNGIDPKLIIPASVKLDSKFSYATGLGEVIRYLLIINLKLVI